MIECNNIKTLYVIHACIKVVYIGNGERGRGLHIEQSGGEITVLTSFITRYAK